MKILICAIHNNSRDRNEYLFPLLREMSAKFNSRICFFSWQSGIVLQTRFWCALRAIYYFVLACRWASYRNRLRIFSIVIQFFSLVKYVILLLTSPNSAFVNKDRYRAAIEPLVTAKHIRAWESFLESDADFGVFFEDDLVFKDDSADRLFAIVSELSCVAQNSPLYIDLAAGINPVDLGVDRLIDGAWNEGVIYKLPVTNTACGYLCDRASVEYFVSQIDKNQFLRRFGIDWVLNSIFLNAKNKLLFFCAHTNPSVFLHGTFSGSYKSWQI